MKMKTSPLANGVILFCSSTSPLYLHLSARPSSSAKHAQMLFRFRIHIGEYWSQYPESPWYTYNRCLFSDYFSPAGRRRCGVAQDLGDSSIVSASEQWTYDSSLKEKRQIQLRD
ncbi:uncharacterized [Tachysurus ichikawai]